MKCADLPAEWGVELKHQTCVTNTTRFISGWFLRKVGFKMFARSVAGFSVCCVAIFATSTNTFACFRHTFDPCKDPVKVIYQIGVDKKTGDTWVKNKIESTVHKFSPIRFRKIAHTLAIEPDAQPLDKFVTTVSVAGKISEKRDFASLD